MKKLFSYHETYVFLAIVIFALIITLINPSFFTLENLFDLLKSYSLMGTFAIGVLFVLISGGIDISFTAIATITGYVIAVLLLSHGDQLNIVYVFMIAGGIGILLGMINAAVIYFFKIPSIITTIATLNIYYGVLTVLSQGKWLYGFPEWFGKYTQMYVFTLKNASGTTYGLSVITVFWFVLLLIAWFILRYTLLGRSIYAMGGNMASASRAGFNLLKIHLFVYSFMGLMAGFASVIQAMLVQTVAPNSLVGKELDVLAAVVLGGASLTGGTGSVLGAVLGVALIAIMGNGLTLMHVPSYWYKVVIGTVILISVGSSAYRRKVSAHRRAIIEVD
ncbi:MAG: ABC transporter permease [Anaerolineales bacterium]|nr:ABC transporter permease [Anaerolineales bacterium]